jgi:hemoglobin
MDDQDVYAAVGPDGFHRLTRAFYRRVQQDPILAPMYPPDDWQGAEERLRDFLIFRFGGPQDYLAKRGHPRLRMRHAPFAITEAARDRWVQLMSESLAESELPDEPRRVLQTFFSDVATFLINR